MPLDEALDRALKAYEKEHRHPVPVEAMAQSLGYKGANSGTALKAIASLRYFGLIERPVEGQLAVAKDVESYQFAPSEDMRRDLRIKWLRNPPVFADLLDRYRGGLPSDTTLRFDLIQKGFLPNSAAEVLAVFRKSSEFASYFEVRDRAENIAPQPTLDEDLHRDATEEHPLVATAPSRLLVESELPSESGSMDRIPVRLSGGRRAWLIIPERFHAADKDVLKAQIDLILAEE